MNSVLKVYVILNESCINNALLDSVHNCYVEVDIVAAFEESRAGG